jgi:hypothetical protein
VWNAQVLLCELRERNYGGGYSILTGNGALFRKSFSTTGCEPSGPAAMNAARSYGTRSSSTSRATGFHAAAVPSLPGPDKRQRGIGSEVCVRRNFLCGLLGREPANLADLNAELRRWVAEVANQRVHGTTHEQVLLRWDEDQFAMQPVLSGRQPSPIWMTSSARWRAYVSCRGSRYSVP